MVLLKWFPKKVGSVAYSIPPLAVYHLDTTYILPSGGLYATYHPLQKPEKSIDVSVSS